MSNDTIELTLEQRRAFYREYDQIIALFGEACRDRLDQLLIRIPLDKLTEVFKAPHTDAYGRTVCRPGKPWYPHAVQLPDAWTGYRFVNNEGWEKYVPDVVCSRWLIPNRYQHLETPPILRALLLDQVPWLAEFSGRLSLYSLDGRVEPEFYLQVTCEGPNKSLYVPFRAFLAGDVEAILERNRSYWRSYYVGARAPEAEATIAAVLGSPDTARFLELCQKVLDK